MVPVPVEVEQVGVLAVLEEVERELRRLAIGAYPAGTSAVVALVCDLVGESVSALRPSEADRLARRLLIDDHGDVAASVMGLAYVVDAASQRASTGRGWCCVDLGGVGVGSDAGSPVAFLEDSVTGAGDGGSGGRRRADQARAWCGA